MPRNSQQILDESERIAVLGASPRRHRESNKIFRYLENQGYTVLPVNPMVEELEGHHSYPNLDSIPDDVVIDIVNIFRRPEHVKGIVQDAIDRSSKLDHPLPVIWTQLGVSSDSGAELAANQDMEYVKNRCILVEHSIATTS